MKKYKVTASYFTECYAEIEAESEDEAYEMALKMDGGSFEPSHINFDWDIKDVEELK